MKRVGDQAADVFISNTFFADHVVLVRQMAQGGVRLRAFLGAFGMEFPDVIRSLGPAAEGLYGTTGWQPGVAAPGQEAASQAFVEAFATRFRVQAAPLAMHGYAAARACSPRWSPPPGAGARSRAPGFATHWPRPTS